MFEPLTMTITFLWNDISQIYNTSEVINIFINPAPFVNTMCNARKKFTLVRRLFVKYTTVRTTYLHFTKSMIQLFRCRHSCE